MVMIPDDFKKGKILETCACGAIENMKHIYTCKLWNQEKEETIEYEEIFKDNTLKQLRISRTFFRNLEQREKFKNDYEGKNLPHVILLCDPLASLIEDTVMDCK